jgi:hypothetical protein
MLEYNINQRGAVTQLTSIDGFNFMVTSDVHFDSAFCNRKQFFEDLDVAVSNGAKIIIVGDFFDGMQGRFDPRRDMSSLRPEYRRADYYDYIVDDAVCQLKRYAEHIVMVCDGNHESSVLKNANTDLTGRFASGLSCENHKVYRGGYGGIILLNQRNYVIPVKYFHGSGGEAPVTRGAIQTNRQAVFLPDFQIVLNGHSHHMYWIPIVRERVLDNGSHYFDVQHHVRTPGYAMTYADGSSGWEVTRGGIPKPIGSWILTINNGEVLPTPLIHVPKPVSPIIDVFDGVTFPQE